MTNQLVGSRRCANRPRTEIIEGGLGVRARIVLKRMLITLLSPLKPVLWLPLPGVARVESPGRAHPALPRHRRQRWRPRANSFRRSRGHGSRGTLPIWGAITGSSSSRTFRPPSPPGAAGEPFPVSLTFDDDLGHHVTHALPEVEKADAPVTFFLCGSVPRGAAGFLVAASAALGRSRRRRGCAPWRRHDSRARWGGRGADTGAPRCRRRRTLALGRPGAR